MKKILPAIAPVIACLYFVIQLFIINDYGVTWDYTYHYNAGLWHLGKPTSDGFIMGPSPPLSDILPAIMQAFFNERLKILDFDAAYNLYGIIVGSAGIVAIYIAGRDLLNNKSGLVALALLALAPRYIGHLHNNMKDIPQAVFFTFSIWAFLRFYLNPGFKNLLIAAAFFGIAYTSKVNAVFVPLIALIFTLAADSVSKKRLKISRRKIYAFLAYLPTCVLAAILIWIPFWDDPWGRMLEAMHSYTTSTTNMPVLYFGNIFYSGNNIPWHYPFGMLFATMPILYSALFIIGAALTTLRFPKNKYYLFLLLWFTIPILRYFKPRMIVIDDIRHFMEIIFPFMLICSVGAIWILDRIKAKTVRSAVIAFGLIYLVWQNVIYHPYQMSYFSEGTGGIRGAAANFDVDFWAISYKKAIMRLNNEALPGAKITVPMAPDIAALYARDDLKKSINKMNLASADPGIYAGSDYTVVMNRKSFFGWYNLRQYISVNKPEWSVGIRGIPLTSVYKNGY